MLRADPKRLVPEFTIVKAEAKAPHVAPAPNAFPKRSAIPELVSYPAATVYSAGSESPLSRGSGTQAPHLLVKSQAVDLQTSTCSTLTYKLQMQMQLQTNKKVPDRAQM